MSVERVAAFMGELLVEALSNCPSRPCPDCGAVSRRVHSRYCRTLADSPVGGRPLLVRLTVRRFFCDSPTCLRRAFVEQIAGLTERHQQATTELRSQLRAIAAEPSKAATSGPWTGRGGKLMASTIPRGRPCAHARRLPRTGTYGEGQRCPATSRAVSVPLCLAGSGCQSPHPGRRSPETEHSPRQRLERQQASSPPGRTSRRRPHRPSRCPRCCGSEARGGRTALRSCACPCGPSGA